MFQSSFSSGGGAVQFPGSKQVFSSHVQQSYPQQIQQTIHHTISQVQQPVHHQVQQTVQIQHPFSQQLQHSYQQGGGHHSYSSSSHHSYSQVPQSYSQNSVQQTILQNMQMSSQLQQLGKYSGGCGKPPAPSQSSLQCSPGVGTCFVNCKDGHAFPDGRVRTVLQCQGGQWMEQNAEPGDSIADCLPVCSPPCLNRGVCIHPDTCSCQPEYTGKFCESVVEPPCSRTPPSPKNSRIVCNSRECTATCLPGNLFPGQLDRIQLDCQDGEWVFRGSFVIPDCQSHCEPACENGGTCLSPGTCLCPRGFKGQACQYESGMCSPEKLGFNGGYNCTSTQYEQRCALICPAGIQFSSPPAPVYTCHFSTGQYQPYPPPSCLFDPGMKIKREGSYFSSSSSMSHYTSSSFSFTQVMSVNYMHETWIRELNLDWRPGQGMIAYSPQSYAALSSLTIQEMMEMIRGQGAWLSFSQPINLFSEERKRLELLLSQDSKKGTGSCYIWAGHHFRTFDGNVFSIPDGQEHIALLEPRDQTVQISVAQDPLHPGALQIYLILEEQRVDLTLDSAGQPRATSAGSSLQLPGSQDGIVLHKSGDWIFVEILGLGLTLRWNSKDFIAIDAESNNWNRTIGLCGSLTDNIFDDFYCMDGQPADLNQFVEKYTIKSDRGVRSVQHSDRCAGSSVLEKRAKNFCKQILSSPDLVDCQAAVSPLPFYEACKMTFCQDEEKACESVEAYVKVCQSRGMQISSWRKPGFCSSQCKAGLEFRECGFGVSPTCGENFDWDDIEFCIPGCYCPHGTRLHNGSCIPVSDCPCENNNRFYPDGQSIRRDCNTCVCSKSKWVCSSEVCGKRCTLDAQHSFISTFSGQHISFDGSCEFTVFSSKDVTIRVELHDCAQFHNSYSAVSSHQPAFCIRRVTIRLDDSVIKLGLQHEVLVDGDELLYPTETEHYTINHPSSLWTTVNLFNEVIVLWNGNNNLYIDVPPTMLGMVKGMCGAFTKNVEDTFLTPDGDVEESPIDFINRWRVDMRCSAAREVDDVCDQDPDLFEQAKQFCSNIKSNIFESCHTQVDPEDAFDTCVTRYCACPASDTDCQCSLIAEYADLCAAKDAEIDWRPEISTCAIRCDTGLHFRSCGNKDIGYSCRSAALDDSHETCLEGCYCPSGLLLDDSGNCIPVSSCTCVAPDGSSQKPLSQDYRESSNEICVCENAKWSCRIATSEDKLAWIRSQHKCGPNQEFTSCVNTTLTCQNMHKFIEAEENKTECHPGCVCSPGYIESESGECILPTNCPCHHGGRSYTDGQTVHKDCNQCVCNDGIWSCSSKECPAICSTWGEGHFITFDKKYYDVLGSCDYTLAKGSLSTSDTFSISMKNVPCGTSRVICAKAVQVTVGRGSNKEIITLNKDADWLNQRKYKRIQITDTSLYLWLDVHDLGLTIQWDKGNKLYITLQPRWKGAVQGLCGNFDGDSSDDLRSPGGVTESSVLSFVDSWRLHSYCPRAEIQKDTCSLFPHRKLWASKKCGVLKSPLFQPCHAEVPLKPWFERCIRDTCGCNVGGDCECMCTALSAYAHACARAGVNIKWRAQGLCALQCPDRHSYTTCAPRCPLKTCHNYFKYSRISQQCTDPTCTEGCKPDPCTEDRIFQDAKNATCILKSECKPKCLMEDDVQYYDGDVMSKSSCEICKCVGHSKVCEDLCGTETDNQSSQFGQDETSGDSYGGSVSSVVVVSCRPGWTHWIQATQPLQQTTPITIVDGNIGGWCARNEIHKIECKKENQLQGSDCSSPNFDLPCRGDTCKQLQYRVLCQCKPDQILMNVSVDVTLGDVTCEENRPLPNLNNCKLYYACYKSAVGRPNLVEKECDSGELFDTSDLTCKQSYNVKKNRPECSQLETDQTDICIDAISELQKLGDSLIKSLEEEQDTKYITSMSKEWTVLRAMQSSLNSHLKTKEALKVAEVQTITEVLNNIEAVKDASTVISIPEILQVVYNCSGLQIGKDCTVPNAHIAIPDDCYSFYHCDTTGELVLKHCGPGTMFNPAHSICDWPLNVYKVRPGCKDVEVETSSRSPATRQPSPPATRQPSPPATRQPSPPATGQPSPLEQPHICPEDSLYELLPDLPDSAFSSSSTQVISRAYLARLNPATTSEFHISNFARSGAYLFSKNMDAWVPKSNNQNEYLQVDLGSVTSVYALKLQGSESLGGYVTTFTLESSSDGAIFNPLTDVYGNIQVLNGPVSWNRPVLVSFPSEIIARYIRIRPKTWHTSIAIKMELFGCSEPETVTWPASSQTPTRTEPSTGNPEFSVYGDITIVPAIISPPPPCSHQDEYDLLYGLHDSDFWSPSVDDLSRPDLVRDSGPDLNSFARNYYANSEADAWSPEFMDLQQYIKIDLQVSTPIFGIVLEGSEFYKAYVTSFTILYSNSFDDVTYHQLIDVNTHKEKVFEGSHDSSTPVQIMFSSPFEARFIRIYPKTWINQIAMRVKLIGCLPSEASSVPPEEEENPSTEPYYETSSESEAASTPSTPRPVYITHTPPAITKELRCLDELKIIGNIAATTVFNNDLLTYGPDQSDIESTTGWRPAYSSVGEVLTVYLGEQTLVSGIQTKGIHASDFWVQAFQIKYTTDKITWMTIKSAGEKSDRVFPGNYDSDTINIQYLDRPIKATYIQIIPLKWHVAIGFRFSLLGCANETTTTVVPTTTEEQDEEVTKSGSESEVPEENPEVFPMYEEEKEESTTTTEKTTSTQSSSTPGSGGGLAGPVVFPTEAATTRKYPVPPQVTTTASQECVRCPGVPVSSGCEQCDAGLMWDGYMCVQLQQCSCYQDGVRVKPNSKVENDECEECVCKDGIITGCQAKVCPECSDGEHSEVTLYCDCICKTCDPGTRLCVTSGTCIDENLWCDGIQNCPDDEQDCPKESEKLSYAGTPCPKPECEAGKTLVETEIETIDGCPFYKCLINQTSDQCSTPTCPDGYELSRISDHAARYSSPGSDLSSPTTKRNLLLGVQCPRYECVPVEVSTPAPVVKMNSVCSYEGNVLTTFDNTTFDKEVCHHTLFWDKQNDVKVEYIKNCDARSCSNKLSIHFVDKHVELDTKLLVHHNTNTYTGDQAAKLWPGCLARLRKVGDTLLFSYSEVVIHWNCNGELTIKAPRDMKVTGLCGNNNQVGQDDWITPAGTRAGSAQQLFDSWREEECEARACPAHLLNNAMRLCRTVRFPPLNECKSKVDGDKFLNICLREICECLEKSDETDTTCKCKIMESYVKKCREADPSVHLQNWRTMHLCPRKCPPGFVYHDCYHHSCESTCDNIRQDQKCAELDSGDSVCFPGCFCPNGLIRDGDTCIQSNQCKNCVCEKKSSLGYSTFDQKSFKLLPDKKLLMSKLDYSGDDTSLEIHAVTSDCSVGYRKQICIDEVELIYYDDTIKIALNQSENNVYVDGQHLKDVSDLPNGLELTYPSESSLLLSVVDVNYEVEADILSREIVIRAPSLMYGSKLEGLCGDCNGDLDNDYKTVSGEIVFNDLVFVTSWIIFDFSVVVDNSATTNGSLQLLPTTTSSTPEPTTTEKDSGYISSCDPTPCQHVLKSQVFDKCHPLVDVDSFIETCNKIYCQDQNKQDALCEIADQYSRECRSHGVCVEFRERWKCDIPDCGPRSVYKECAPGCPQTCNKDVTCTGLDGPGCVCKPGLVMIQGRCEPASNCITCLQQGATRKLNETWKTDECTTCTCSESVGVSGEVVCTQQKCEPVICPPGYKRQPLNSTSQADQCCQEQICVEVDKEPLAQCGDLIRPDCATFQEVKTVTENGCQKLVCECVDVCPSLEPSDFDLLPGESLVTVNTGCCPFLEVKCDHDSCPEDAGCPQYLIRTLNITTKDDCCPHYYCDKPDDKCLYTMKNENIGAVVAMNVSEVWKDGSCRKCKCNPARPTKECPDKAPEPVCTVQRCNNRQKKLDKIRYVLEDIVVEGECCYDYKKVACIHQGTTYQMGESWSDPLDVCKQYECAQDSEGEANLEVKRETCNEDCPKGSEYIHEDLSVCCGHCRQVQCVLEEGQDQPAPGGYGAVGGGGAGVLDLGESVPVQCGELLCRLQDNKAVLVKETVKCPHFNTSCSQQNVRTSEDGCCNTCVQCKDQTTGQLHDVGDTWQKDPCTSCTCNDAGEILCSVTDCQEPVCAIGYRIVNVESEVEECCPRSECEPEVLPCPPVIQPTCATDQVLKKVTADNGCISYVCECRSDCPAAVKSGILLPGESWSLVTSTCCQQYKRSCDPGICPPVTCPTYYEAKIDKSDACCPEFSCERPKDMCLHSATNSTDSSQQIVKQIGDKWNDDVCKTCTCVQTVTGGPEVECETETCPPAPDSREYVFQQVQDPRKCCPEWNKIGCKVGEASKEVGSEWTGGTPCDQYSCVRDLQDNQIHIRYKQKQCDNNCQQGFSYTVSAGECCGTCVQTHCVSSSGQTILPNETRRVDSCKTEKCVPSGEHKYVLVEEVENCAELDPDCPKENIITSPNGCCNICNYTDTSCSLTEMSDTVGLISFFDDEHGNCSNVEAISGMRECRGKCKSGSKFDTRLGYHVSQCTCCQQIGETNINVLVTCTDGVQLSRDVSVPSSCSCESCSEMLAEQQHQNEYGGNAAYSGESGGYNVRSGLVQAEGQEGLQGEQGAD